MSHTVIANGTRVRCTSVDTEGLQGRDLHPTEDDVGWSGIVQGNVAEVGDADGPNDRMHDVLGGTEVPDEAVVIYTVAGLLDDRRGPSRRNARVLQLASYEVEELA